METKVRKKHSRMFWVEVSIEIACLAVFITVSVIGLATNGYSAALTFTALISLALFAFCSICPIAVKCFRDKSVKHKVCGGILVLLLAGLTAVTCFTMSVIPSYVQASEQYQTTTEKWENTPADDVNYKQFLDEWRDASKKVNDLQMKLLWLRVGYLTILLAYSITRIVINSLNEHDKNNSDKNDIKLL